jgi:hypothetical protein
MQKICPREITASCLSFLKTAGSLRFLNRRFSDSEILKKSGIDGCVFF